MEWYPFGAICPTSTQLLWLLNKSEHSQAWRHSPYLRHLREIAEGTRHASAMNKDLSPLLRPVSNFSTQPFTSWVGATLQLPIPIVAVKHNCYPSYSRCARSGYPSWGHASWLPENQVVRISYFPHAARGYHVKLQRQRYTDDVRQIKLHTIYCGARLRLPKYVQVCQNWRHYFDTHFCHKIAHCKNRLVVLTTEWLPWLHVLVW